MLILALLIGLCRQYKARSLLRSLIPPRAVLNATALSLKATALQPQFPDLVHTLKDALSTRCPPRSLTEADPASRNRLRDVFSATATPRPPRVHHHVAL